MTQPEPKEASASRNSLLEAVESLLSEGRPLEVGAFELTADGKLRRRETGTPLVFSFDFRGIFIDVEVTTEVGGKVTLHATLGSVPYSVESPKARRAIRSIVAVAGKQPRGRLYFGDDQSLRLEASAEPPTPCTPAAVVATITAVLLDFIPILDILAAQMTVESRRPQAPVSPTGAKGNAA